MNDCFSLNVKTNAWILKNQNTKILTSRLTKLRFWKKNSLEKKFFSWLTKCEKKYVLQLNNFLFVLHNEKRFEQNYETKRKKQIMYWK